jgi:hypothetical protein
MISSYQRDRLALGLRPELAPQGRRVDLVLAQRRAAPSGLDVELHQRAVRRLLQRVQGEQPQRGLDRRFGRSPRAVVVQQPGQCPEGHFVKALALTAQPIFERRLLDRQSFQQVAPIERDRLRECLRRAFLHAALELEDVDADGVWIDRDQVAVGMERFALGPSQNSPQRIQGLAKARPRRGVDGASPEQTCQLVPGVGLAGRHRQVRQEGLCLPGGKCQRSAGIEVGSKAAQ